MLTVVLRTDSVNKAIGQGRSILQLDTSTRTVQRHATLLAVARLSRGGDEGHFKHLITRSMQLQRLTVALTEAPRVAEAHRHTAILLAVLIVAKLSPR